MHGHLCKIPRRFKETVVGKESKGLAYNRWKNLLKNIHHFDFELVDKPVLSAE
jgi:hypothetical protein